MEVLAAETILQGADAMYGRFLDITAGALTRFECQDWKKVQLALKNRIQCYDHHVNLVSEQLRSMLDKKHLCRAFLTGVKTCYSERLTDYPKYDIAESFFNSVYCTLFDHKNICRDRLFVNSSQKKPVQNSTFPFIKNYQTSTNAKSEIAIKNAINKTVEKILDETPFTLNWENKTRDIKAVTKRLQSVLLGLQQQINKATDTNKNQRIPVKESILSWEMIREPFFRNKAAYLIGQVKSNHQACPFVLAILINSEQELYIDACITSENDMSILFGFARSYFMVYAPFPAALVAFLTELMPSKTASQLYTAIGCQKHGKTELYREFLAHLDKSNDAFVLAPGIKGMVMSVFTLPSYDFVFKIIKDKFAPQKNISHKKVKEKYQLVKEHDRVGRLADTLDYRYFSFPRARFSEALLAELALVAPSQLKISANEVQIKHLYMERRMVPLNLYLETASQDECKTAVQGYGDAIKELAAANIFAGDMLPKNFGVSRHQRVIFYDYDEISYLTDINFRAIPTPRYPEDEMAAEPWYSVGENDVFPEEFRSFLFADPTIRQLFERLHKDFFDPSYWIQLQKQVHQGIVNDVFPYPQALRFKYPRHT